MELISGSVIALPDPRVRPRKRLKWHICVCPDRRLFLRINSRPLWPPHHLIKASKNPFLEHDSYVELTSLHFFTESELRGATKVGEMPSLERALVADAAQEAETLREEHRELIWEKFGIG